MYAFKGDYRLNRVRPVLAIAALGCAAAALLAVRARRHRRDWLD